MPFKICVIGCGDISIGQHGPGIKRYEELHDNTLFAACCDINGERAEAYRKKFNIPNCYTDLEVMLDTEKPDAVCLISPVNVTMELSIRVMEKGYPVILEKPPGLDGNETRKMMKAAEATRTPNQVAFNRRYMPLVQKMAEIINDPAEIMDIHYRMVRVGRKDANFATTAIHGIDLVKYVAGSDYKHVNFRYNELPQYGPSVANFHLDGVMANGTVVNLDFLPVSGVLTERLEVNTHKGLFWLDLPLGPSCYDMPGKLTQLVGNKLVLVISGEEAAEDFMLNGFYHENKRFFDDIRGGKKPVGDIASGLQSVEIADCIYRREARYAPE
jgi:predicted dehydrogenase